MKTLLYRVKLLDADDLDFRVLFLSYFCKVLMILAIAFLVFLLTSKNYSAQSFGKNSMDSSEQVMSHPPSPFY